MFGLKESWQEGKFISCRLLAEFFFSVKKKNVTNIAMKSEKQYKIPMKLIEL